VEKQVLEIYQAIQKLIGLHRQLLDVVRNERETLIEANVKAIEEITSIKQGLIGEIRAVEAERMRATAELARLWRREPIELTLGNLIIIVQGRDLKLAEQLRTSLNAITILIERITEQNESNRALVERSLEHVHEMKKNILGESVPKSTTYTQQGQKTPGMQGARIISKEA
jgi:hypothetical protein